MQRRYPVPNSQIPQEFSHSFDNLTCQATIGTLISRKWLKDGHPLSPSNRITFSSDNSSASIDPRQGTDNGQYQCRLTNPVSTDTANYNLTVNYGPEDVVIQGQREMDAGQTVVLTCSVSSVPPATFIWTFNGKETGVKAEEYPVANATLDDSGNYVHLCGCEFCDWFNYFLCFTFVDG
ncbi:hypothetical protein SKAU_G00223240 [Synaphobranchus kaupii]|uniref:Ig-like domain-containing protein n=1 Tax=Synaphobranchus kaupii TaxID=118154 RepID=A0A9Q1FBD3_SYNKA|nr:hypothetical protein SKAU_G00223240 [Synaphobranchus kaupii]